MNDSHDSNNASVSWIDVAAVLCVLVCTGMTFAGVIDNNFVYNDNEMLLQNPAIAEAGLGDLFGRGFFEVFREARWRPLTSMGYALEIRIFGLNSAPMHAVSLGWMLFGTLMVFLLVRTATRSTWPAIVGSLFFGLHPALVEPVSAITFREDLVVAALAAAALWAHLKSSRSTESVTAWTAISSVLVLGACLTKESGAVLPALMLLVDGASNGWSFRAIKRIVPAGIIASAYFLLRVTIMDTPDEAMLFAQWVDNSFWLSLLNLPARALGYLSHALWPFNLKPEYVQENILGFGWRAVWTWALYLGLAALAAWLCVRRPLIGVGLAGFLVALLPSLDLFPLSVKFADRRLSLPLVMLAISVGWVLASAAESKGWRKILLVVPAAMIPAFMFTSSGLVKIWHDDYTLWSFAVRNTPQSAFAHNNYGIALSRIGKLNSAAEEFQAAIALDPGYSDPEANLALVYIQQGRAEAAVEHAERAVEMNPRFSLVWITAGRAYFEAGDYEKAAEHLTKALTLDGNSDTAHTLMGMTMGGMGFEDHAIAELERAIEINPENIQARGTLAGALSLKGDYTGALTHYEFLRSRLPDDLRVRMGTIQSLTDLNRFREALEMARAVVRDEPEFPDGWLALGRLNEKTNDLDGARAAYTTALELRPEWAEALERLQALGETGEPDD